MTLFEWDLPNLGDDSSLVACQADVRQAVPAKPGARRGHVSRTSLSKFLLSAAVVVACFAVAATGVYGDSLNTTASITTLAETCTGGNGGAMTCTGSSKT